MTHVSSHSSICPFPLQELFLSHNILDRLPNTLHRLQRLEILDVSHNQLNSVDDIKQMANLRVLLLNGNPLLHVLPSTLATCDSLNDLVISPETIRQPPSHICEQGTKAILNYLMGALSDTDQIKVPLYTKAQLAEEALATKLFLENENLDRLVGNHLSSSRKEIQLKTDELLTSERMALERNQKLEAAARNEQDSRRENLLKVIMAQQDLQESQINELNSQKNENRNILIRDIIEEEGRWRILVQQSIEVKSFAVDPMLLEQEADEQSRLLNQSKVAQEELRKQEVLRAMQSLLDSELQQVESYQKQKTSNSSRVLIKETEKMNLLSDVFEGYHQNRSRVVEQIMSDESVQKSAVATLISRKDARSWALVEQMRIIENHLAAISTFELEKSQDGSSRQLSDLAERRIQLSQVLVELMEQQDLRRKELVEMLTKIERERDEGMDYFWLMQYQRLLESQPERVNFDSQVNPELGYNFLVNGVVHCLPFLSRLWQDESKGLHEIGDEDLKQAGIRKESDRAGILKSIQQFLDHRMEKGGTVGENTEKEMKVEDVVAQGGEVIEESDRRQVDQEEQLAECVICMDKKVKIIFLLCGHLACCEDCHESVNICPMCRAPIQQRIRVIQA